MEKAGWSIATTFARFYNKPTGKDDQFANHVLSTIKSLRGHRGSAADAFVVLFAINHILINACVSFKI